MNDIDKLRELGANLTEFNRLERGFAALGFCLCSLDGEKLYLALPALDVWRTVPDLRTARALLRKIGGGT